jgi:hypothetical protein
MPRIAISNEFILVNKPDEDTVRQEVKFQALKHLILKERPRQGDARIFDVSFTDG